MTHPLQCCEIDSVRASANPKGCCSLENYFLQKEMNRGILSLVEIIIISNLDSPFKTWLGLLSHSHIFTQKFLGTVTGSRRCVSIQTLSQSTKSPYPWQGFLVASSCGCNKKIHKESCTSNNSQRVYIFIKQ